MKIIPNRFVYPTRAFNVVGFEISPTEDTGRINQAHFGSVRTRRGPPTTRLGECGLKMNA